MKITHAGEPVNWIHHNFQINMREFPIQTSKISETIFTRKLVSTLSEIIFFADYQEIETIADLKDRLTKMKKSQL